MVSNKWDIIIFKTLELYRIKVFFLKAPCINARRKKFLVMAGGPTLVL
jgi:hypothetical protein